MLKKKIATLIVTVMMIMLVGCSSSDSTVGKRLFAKIEIDYSKTLTTNTNSYHYYYLKDTGIVYVGFLNSTGFSNSDVITPVISPNGNYYRYDVEEQMVVEIVGDAN